MERTGNQILSNHLWRKQITQFRKWEKDLGVPSADLGRGKGKQATKKISHGCRKTPRAWKIFPSADLELDKEVENFSLQESYFTQGKTYKCG